MNSNLFPTEDVYICFGAWNTWKSRIICWITNSRHSHVWVQYISNRWGGTIVVHADSKGVIIEPVANFYKRRGVPSSYSLYKVIKGDSSQGFIKSREYLGKDYGYFAVVANLVLMLFRKLGFSGLNAVRDIGKYVCSEFATLFINNSKIPSNLDPELTWPGKLEQQLLALPKNFEKVL